MHIFSLTHTALHRQTRLINLSLILAMLITLLPLAPQAAQAAAVNSPSANQPANPNSADPNSANPNETSCTVTGIGPKVFLPVVANGGTVVVTPEPPAETPVVIAPSQRSLRFQTGKTYTYHYDLAVQSQSTSKEAAGVQKSDGQALGVIADADVTITGKEGADIFLGKLSLRNVTICNAEANGAGVLVEDEELLKALAEPLLFKQSSNGTIVEVSYPQGAPDMAVNLQKGILNSLQLTLKGDEASYEVEESGGQGVYKVKYNTSANKTGLNLTLILNRHFTQESFSNLLQSGDENKEMLLQNQSTIVLDVTVGALKSVNVIEQIVSADESQNATSTDDTFDGATATSGTQTRSTLTLNNIIDTPAEAADAPNTIYVVGDLGASLSDEGSFRPGIDLDTVNLAAELDTLEADPSNPEQVQRVADLLHADDGQTVLDTLRQRLLNSTTNDDRATGYLDTLGVNGSPAAQALFASALVSSPFSLAVQEHALIGLIAIRKPTTGTLELAQRIAGDPSSPLHDLGLLVLGGVANHISDPTGGLTGRIKFQMLDGLKNATNDETRILFIDALGNLGDATTLGDIEGFIGSTNSFDLREAAIQALRKLPAAAVEDQLLKLLNASDEEPEVREIVANVLRGRTLSATAAAALAAYETQSEIAAASLAQTNDASWKYSWNKHLGGKKLGVDLPGSVAAAEKINPVRNVSLVARQEAVAHAWSFKYNLALAELISKRKGDKQELKVTFSLLNNKIKKNFDKEVQCAYEKSANLYKATHTLIDYSVKIPVWAIITVHLGIRATGSISLDYSYNLDVCNPLKPLVSGSITPAVSATLEGYAALSIVVVRGGAGISGTLLKTSIPATLTAKRDTSFELCMDIKVKTKPLTIAVKLFAERRKLFGGWKRFLDKTLFKYETPEKNYVLLAKCLK